MYIIPFNFPQRRCLNRFIESIVYGALLETNYKERLNSKLKETWFRLPNSRSNSVTV